MKPAEIGVAGERRRACARCGEEQAERISPLEPPPPRRETLTAKELAAVRVDDLQAGAVRMVDLSGGVVLAMIWCPPGSGMTRGFWLGKYEITQGQWQHVMGRNPSRYGKNDPERMPVDSVSLADCERFTARLNEMTGTSCFRLPSVAEWEYACTAGGRTTGVSAEGVNSRESRRKGPSAVGSYSANEWGFCDMLGNVGEWTPDDFRGHLLQRDGKAVCGGWWNLRATECTPGFRYRANGNDANRFFGMRICFSSEGGK